MKTYAGNAHQSQAKAPAQRREKGQPVSGLADNRPQAAVQRELHDAANGSSRVAQLRALEQVANGAVAQLARNHTGLPDQLKSGIESLSGHSMDDVKVHYNSSKPAQLNAHAYAQGSDIHLASGQEKHLAHEAWHVVQQKQGRVKPTMQMKAVPVRAGVAAAGTPATGPSPVQRVVREATVSWGTTHLVRAKGDSLFGEGNDWQSREVPPGRLGQLSHGQKVMVDDEAVFMSRRGGNQEKASRREADREADELRHKWLKVLAVWDGKKFVKVPKKSYVRAETVTLPPAPKPPQKDIRIDRHGPEQEKMVSEDLERFHGAWDEAARKRRRSIGRVVNDFEGEATEHGDDITSGWNWDKFDEGANVSGDMKKPGERTPFGKAEDQHVLSANYDGASREPVAYMIIEKAEHDGVHYMYIRWLIAHPEKGGGGTALVERAIHMFESQKDCTELRVDSAFSAVGWYEKLGFRKVPPVRGAVKKGVGYADTELVYTKKT